MINIFYTRLNNRLTLPDFESMLNRLPAYMQHKVRRYRKWEDAQRSLFGKALLLNGLEELNLKLFHLEDLKYTEYDRPYFESGLNFNISHSGEYVICALSEVTRIGIDIEKIITVPFEDFEENFSVKEWEHIRTSDNVWFSFFTHWTQKEAFLKAIGMGLNVPLWKVEFVNGQINWEGETWNIFKIPVDEHHIAHLACDTISPNIITKEVLLN